MGAIATTRQAAIAVEEEAQYLTFMLGTEMFAIGILFFGITLQVGFALMRLLQRHLGRLATRDSSGP